MAMTMPTAMYTTTFDAADRHDYGIKKHRKNPSTGGGRAWSEDEEAYLLRTRLQKMPYKHIAAHLKKTELACRLHYHQLSQGSNRRRRTTSISSSSSFSSNGHSPTMPVKIPSPVYEHAPSRALSPPGAMGSCGHNGSPGAVHLPSIRDAGMASPRLPVILPKPANMTLDASVPRYSALQTQAHAQHNAPLLPPVTFAAAHERAPTPSGPPHSDAVAPLRLDCSGLPPPPNAGSVQPVDMARLHAVYIAHRGSFWSAIAADYGSGVHPAMLEQAWRTGKPPGGPSCAHNYAAYTPITPVGSPEGSRVYGGKYQDKTRISAILGMDASPRSLEERELVRRMEERRVSMVGVGA